MNTSSDILRSTDRRSRRSALRVSGLACGLALLFIMMSGSWCRAEGNPWWDNYRVQLKLAYGDIEDLNNEYGTTTLEELAPLFLLSIPEETPQEILLALLNADPRVDWAEPSYLDETPEGTRLMVVAIVGGTVDDYLDQNVFERIRLDAIQPYTQGEGVTIALIDTGIDYDHPALFHVVSGKGWDFVGNDGDPFDEGNGFDEDSDGQTDEGRGHGTMVAGIAHLVAPAATLLPIRVLDDEGRGDSFDVARGIRYAVQQGADVINLSLGLTLFCHTIEHELAAASEAGVMIVAAAGNDNTHEPAYFPASDPRAISVAAADSQDVKASFSNYHETVDVSAPGDGIMAPFPDGQWAVGAGTSFAAPFVSGQAALVRSVIGEPPDTQTWDPIRRGVVPIDDLPGNEAFRGLLGTGRFDGLATLEALLSTTQAPDDVQNLRGLFASPNPAGPGATAFVHWNGARSIRSATIHDISGRSIGEGALRDGRVEWDGNDRSGKLVSPGHYYLRIQPTDGPAMTAPMVRTSR